MTDAWSPASDWPDVNETAGVLGSLGCRVLRNQRVRISLPGAADSFDLAGDDIG